MVGGSHSAGGLSAEPGHVRFSRRSAALVSFGLVLPDPCSPPQPHAKEIRYVADQLQMDQSRRAKIFWSGRSQAVRLPREFRFEGSEVWIRREGNTVILEAIDKARWPEGFWERLASLPELTDDFARPAALPDSSHRDAVLDNIDDA